MYRIKTPVQKSDLLTIIMIVFKRHFSTRIKVSLAEDIMKSINNNEYKPRKHPGINVTKNVSLPKQFVMATEKILSDYPVKGLVKSAQELNRHLKGRLPPMENKDIKKVIVKAQNDIMFTMKDVEINEEDNRLKQSIKDKTKNLLKHRIYNWQPIKYDTHNSLLYLLARSAQEYAVLLKIMSEIVSRDPSFKPRSLFDFGSGVGLSTWAAITFWKEYIFEYFNVDISRDMNDLAQLLLQGGCSTGKMEIQGVFYRQFLPASNNTYDLVISAYSLLELPSVKARMETILKLWNKTENYLIIVEQGNKAGFQIINEVRDFVLQLSEGYVFSPCPHDIVCPKFISEKRSTCHFPVNYFAFPLFGKKEFYHELYSYVVLKKGKRPQNSEWSRLIQPTLVRSKHSICRMCHSDGNLKEIIFTSSKHGKPLYYCARKTRWGDLLPIKIDDENELLGNEIDVEKNVT